MPLKGPTLLVMPGADEISEADRRRWEELARSGNLDGMFNLGLALRDSDPAEAQRLWKTAAASGHVLSMYSLGVVLADEDQEAAISWYEQAAAHEYPPALFNLGLMLVDTDRVRTRALWKQAARLGHSKSKKALVALRWPWKWPYSPRPS